MKIKKISSFIILILILSISFLLGGFNLFKKKDNALNKALMYAGENKIELQKVIDHYKGNPDDSLKLKAALFLIENMPYHSWETGLKDYDPVFDSMANLSLSVDINVRRDMFKIMLDSVGKISQSKSPTRKYDVQLLDAHFLINNIDLAFEAWYKYPPEKRADFETFCNYILPYRNKDEPIEIGMRKKFMETYNWVFESLNAGVSLQKVADSIIKNFTHENLITLRSSYPLPLSPEQYEKSRIGICQDGVTYFIHVFRALGIASADDFVTHWGNHHSLGHNWMKLTFGDEVYFESSTVKNNYKNESIPKVFRRTFSVNRINNEPYLYEDVISDYKETVDVEVPIIFNVPKEKARGVVNIFDVTRQWYEVAGGEITNGKLMLKKLGTNVVYFSGYYSSDKLYAVNYPFFVGLDKSINYFKPKKEIYDSVILLRKSGMMPYRDKDWKRSWIDNLNGTEFQVSNDISFKNYEVLATITNFNSTHVQTITLQKNISSFKYLRVYNEKDIFLAKLQLMDINGNEISYSPIYRGKTVEINWKGATDDDPLTFSSITKSTSNLKIDKPHSIIKSIKFQARNDDNHIHIGDQYELFYWDKSWKSLGQKKATDTLLMYNSMVPKNSLLWLRNLSRGKEENAFTIDENGRQKWLGFYF